MGLETPRLDDRTFNDLVDEARARIPLYAPEWTDHNMSDPGITLIELFAWMTDIVLYRLNRVPDKHFVKFMELIGIRLEEAEPARTSLTFWLSAPQLTPLVIPNGTQAATARTENDTAIVFTTDGELTIQIPQLGSVMTAVGEDDKRAFNRFDAESVRTGFETIVAFNSNPPANNDAFLLGFENDLSNHLIGVELEVDTAEGAGIDPTHPPYVWEVLTTDLSQTWTRVFVEEDTTLGLNISGIIKMHLPPLRRAIRNDLNFFWLRCRLDSMTVESRYNISPRLKRVTISSWGGTVNATNVDVVTNEVIGRSDGSPGQTFLLAHSPLIARSSSEFLLVRRDDGREERWQEVTDFSSSMPNDRHYTIDSDTGELRLGPALPMRDGQVRRYGALAPKNAMLLMMRYRYGGGLSGNVAINTINELKSSMPYISRVTNRFPARGGMDTESLESAKTRVPHFMRSLGRAVTAADFEYLAKEAAPGRIGRVYCLQPPLTNRGEIKVLLIPQIPRLSGFIAPESLEVAADLRETVQSYLDDRRLLATQLEITQPTYQWVESETRISVSATLEIEKVRAAVEKRLFEFVNPLTGGVDGQGWKFGRDLFVSDLTAVLLSVPGVNFVRSVKLFPVNYDKRQFTRGAETQEIRLPPQGVVVSFQHTILTD
ncbi:MAG: putative baseplate assembly protein [Chloroflexota bacterium]|nr:putative baseplate assembly protein [Chloroflexota bacterium]